ncbi:hypothetical protein EGW08_006368, partial [Elysia chlorotica]
CSFPEVNPFDPAIQYALNKLKPLDCAATGIPNLVRVENQVIIVDHVKVKTVLKKGSTFKHCLYHVLKLQVNSDKKTEIAQTRGSFNVSMKVDPKDEEIRVDCLDSKNTTISKSWFAYVRVDPQRQKVLDDSYKNHVDKKKPVETLSILMIGVDGFAKQHFARSMPKSRDFLIKELGALEMHKHGKLGYSTFPNVMGLLTGKTALEFSQDPKWKFNTKGWMDQINEAFIWSEARRLGYRTGLIMDQVSITAFHFLKNGYRKKPVDHYLRRIVVDSEKDSLMRKTKKNCYGDESEVSKMYDYWFQLLHHYNSTKSNRTPFFAYSFLARLTHDDYNGAFMGDEMYLTFLKGLKNSNALNNTVIVWFSDHGERFGKIRYTYQGTIESSTPYLFFVFPPWFEKKYPDVMRVFRTNQNRLTSHYDTYATMQDILNFKGVVGPKGQLGQRSISMFREIPEDRTCSDAKIPAEFCVCARFSKAKLSPSLDNYLGMVLRNKVAALTKPQRTKCVDLHLGSVESILEETDTGKDAKKGVRLFRVSIMTEPGQGLFEATLEFEVKKNSAKVVGEVARTNMYRGQADCVSTVELRRYCYSAVCDTATDTHWAELSTDQTWSETHPPVPVCLYNVLACDLYL